MVYCGVVNVLAVSLSLYMCANVGACCVCMSNCVEYNNDNIKHVTKARRIRWNFYTDSLTVI